MALPVFKSPGCQASPVLALAPFSGSLLPSPLQTTSRWGLPLPKARLGSPRLLPGPQREVQKDVRLEVALNRPLRFSTAATHLDSYPPYQFLEMLRMLLPLGQDPPARARRRPSPNSALSHPFYFQPSLGLADAPRRSYFRT